MSKLYYLQFSKWNFKLCMIAMFYPIKLHHAIILFNERFSTALFLRLLWLLSWVLTSMPRTCKWKQPLDKSREVKKLKQGGFDEPSASVLMDESGVYISDEDEMYDPQMADRHDMEANFHQYAQELVT